MLYTYTVVSVLKLVEKKLILQRKARSRLYSQMQLSLDVNLNFLSYSIYLFLHHFIRFVNPWNFQQIAQTGHFYERTDLSSPHRKSTFPLHGREVKEFYSPQRRIFDENIKEVTIHHKHSFRKTLYRNRQSVQFSFQDKVIFFLSLSFILYSILSPRNYFFLSFPVLSCFK